MNGKSQTKNVLAVSKNKFQIDTLYKKHKSQESLTDIRVVTSQVPIKASKSKQNLSPNNNVKNVANTNYNKLTSLKIKNVMNMKMNNFNKPENLNNISGVHISNNSPTANQGAYSNIFCNNTSNKTVHEGNNHNANINANNGITNGNTTNTISSLKRFSNSKSEKKIFSSQNKGNYNFQNIINSNIQASNNANLLNHNPDRANITNFSLNNFNISNALNKFKKPNNKIEETSDKTSNVIMSSTNFNFCENIFSKDCAKIIDTEENEDELLDMETPEKYNNLNNLLSSKQNLNETFKNLKNNVESDALFAKNINNINPNENTNNSIGKTFNNQIKTNNVSIENNNNGNLSDYIDEYDEIRSNGMLRDFYTNSIGEASCSLVDKGEGIINNIPNTFVRQSENKLIIYKSSKPHMNIADKNRVFEINASKIIINNQSENPELVNENSICNYNTHNDDVSLLYSVLYNTTNPNLNKLHENPSDSNLNNNLTTKTTTEMGNNNVPIFVNLNSENIQKKAYECTENPIILVSQSSCFETTKLELLNNEKKNHGNTNRHLNDENSTCNYQTNSNNYVNKNNANNHINKNNNNLINSNSNKILNTNLDYKKYLAYSKNNTNNIINKNSSQNNAVNNISTEQEAMGNEIFLTDNNFGIISSNLNLHSHPNKIIIKSVNNTTSSNFNQNLQNKKAGNILGKNANNAIRLTNNNANINANYMSNREALKLNHLLKNAGDKKTNLTNNLNNSTNFVYQGYVNCGDNNLNFCTDIKKRNSEQDIQNDLPENNDINKNSNLNLNINLNKNLNQDNRNNKVITLSNATTIVNKSLNLANSDSRGPKECDFTQKEIKYDAEKINILNENNYLNQTNANNLTQNSDLSTNDKNTTNNNNTNIKNINECENPSIQLYNKLLISAKKGDRELFLEILSKIYKIEGNNTNIQFRDETGWTALHYAADEGNFKIIEILMKMNINPNLRTASKKTALHLSAEKGYFDVSKMLIENGALLSLLDDEKNSPIHLTSLKGHYELLKFFLEKYPQADSKNIYGRTPLDLAINDKIKALIVDFLTKNTYNYHKITIHTANNKKANEFLNTFKDKKTFNNCDNATSVNNHGTGRNNIYNRNSLHIVNLSSKLNNGAYLNNNNTSNENLKNKNSLNNNLNSNNINNNNKSKGNPESNNTNKSNLNSHIVNFLNTNLENNPQTVLSESNKVNKVYLTNLQDSKNIKVDLSSSSGSSLKLSSNNNANSSSLDNIISKRMKTADGYSEEYSANSNLENVSSYEEEKIGPASFICHALLGKGSFGEVYLVEKRDTKIFYAMKVLSKDKIMGNLFKQLR